MRSQASGPTIRVVDTLHLGTPGVIGATVVGEERLALIDCGPATVFENTVAAIRRLGLRPEAVTDVLATHIHLDHSGGAWRWARDYGATVWAHPAGVPHLVDPARLVASATRVFGERMPVLWGEVRPIPEAQVRVVENGAEIDLGGVKVRAIATPGHAWHHNAYWFEEARTLHAGDVAGVRVAGGPCLPPCPPPDIDLDSWKASLTKIRALRPVRIVLTHFGDLTEIDRSLAELEERLGDWAEWVRSRVDAGESEEVMVPGFERKVWDELRAGGVDEAGIRAYEQGDPAAMSVYGLARYWRKRGHGEGKARTG